MKHRLMKKVVSLMVLFSLLFSLLGNIFLEAEKIYANSNTQALTMQIINLNGDGSITTESEFWGEENIPAAANLVVSGDGVEIPNPWLLLTVPKIKTPDGSMKISKPNFVDSQNAYRTEKYEDDDNYYVLYKFRSVSGGTNVTFPFPFKFIGGRVRNQDQLNIKFDMLQGTYQTEDATIDGFKALPKLHESTKTYIGRAQQAVINDSHHSLHNYVRTDNTRKAHVYTLESVAGQTTTGEKGRSISTNFGEVMVIGQEPNIDFVNGKRTEHIIPDSIKIEFDMPEYGVLTQSAKDQGWTYDENTRVATLVKPGNQIQYWGGNEWYRGGKAGGTQWGDFINMVNAPFNEENGDPKIYTINSRYWVTNPGESEKRLTDRSSSFYLEPKYFEPGMHFYSLKDNYTNSGQAADGLKYNLNEGAHVYYDNKIFDKSYERTEEGMPYQLNLSSASNGTAYDNPYGGNTTKIWDIQDYLLTQGEQGRIYYKSFMISTAWNTSEYGNRWSAEKNKESLDKTKEELNGNNTLYGVLEDGSLEVIAQNVKLGQKIEINDVASKYRGLKLSFENPVELNNTGFQMITRVLPTQAELDKFDDGTYVNRQYYRGHFRINKTHGAPGEVGERPTDALERWPINNHGHDYAYNSLDSISPKANIWQSGNDTVVFKTGGSEFDQWTAFSTRKTDGEWGPFAKEPIENVKYIKLLPPGFEFVRVNYKDWYNPSNKISEPTVVKNFRNSGRTALIYNIEQLLPENGTMDDAHIGEKLVATKYAERGNNRIDSFLVYPKNNIIKPNSDSIAYKDELDLDEDGDTNEYFIRSHSYINYIPPLELIVKKEIAYDNKPNTEWGLVATGDLGYEFYYKVKIFNNTIADAKSVHVIDVLPYKGDHYIVANSDGEYLDRGSKFATPLVGAIEDIPENAAVIQKFDIFYQITPQGADLDSVRNGVWLPKDAVTDFSQVKSVKFVLKQGQVIPSKQEVNFIVKAKLPYDTTIEPGEVANNTPAISTDGANYAEGNLVSVTYTKYKVEGLFFKDINKDGLLREDEEKEGIQGRTVELIDAETGEVAVDFDGRAIPATLTDEEGKYSFEVFRRGNYKIRFTKLDTEEYTPNHFNNNVKASNAETTQDDMAETFKFELSPARDKAIQNVGVITTKRNVNVLKYYYEELPADAEEGTPRKQIPLEGATFELVSVSNPNVKFEARSGMDGIATFKEVPFGDYKLKETVVPQGYARVISEEGQNVTVGENKIVAIKVENVPIKRNIKFKKVDEDGMTPLVGVVFELYDTKGTEDTTDDTKVGGDVTSNNEGFVVFENVPYGKYRIMEKSTLEGYRLPTVAVKEVTVSEAGVEAIDLENVSNAKIKSNVSFTKVDADDNNVKLEGAVFELYDTKGTEDKTDDIKVGDEVTSDNEGLVTFENVPYGKYRILEKTAPEGYVKSDNELSVTVGQEVVLSSNTFANTKIKGSITFTKVDAEEASLKLDGVTFGLYEKNETETLEDDTEVASATSNAEGVVSFENVAYGNYYVKEKATKEGYVLSTATTDVAIVNDGEEVSLGNITNAKIKAEVTVEKVEEGDESKKIEGVTFELRKDGTKIAEAVTGEDGIATFTKIPFGTYTLHEVATTDAYLLSDETKEVVVSSPEGVKLGRFTNQIKKGSVSVTKVDKENPEKKLKGVTFALKKGEEEIATQVTGEDGVATFENVRYGKYTLVEKTPLVNYVANPTELEVNIDQDGQALDLGNFENTLKKGRVTFVKVDKEDETKTLEGVVFVLKQGEEEVYEATSDENGVVNFEHVVYGEYTLVEKTPLPSYNQLTEETPVNIDADGKVVKLDKVSNQIKKGSVSIIKVDKENHDKKLAGVTFVLKQDGEVKYTAITNEEGKALFTGVIYGDYTLEETKTLDNYNLSNETRNVEVREEGKEVELGEFENQIIKGSVTLTKVDADDESKTLEGVTFVLTQEDKEVYEATSDKNGIVTFEHVVYGDYELKEKATIESHNLSKETRSIKVRKEGEKIEVGNITNQIKKGDVTFVKVDQENPEIKLAGTLFELYPVGSDTPLMNATSNDKGIVTFSKVPYGDYLLKEKSTIEGYNLNPETREVQIRAEGEKVELSDFTNKMIRGDISVTKVDKDDNTKRLKGVVFALMKDGKELERQTTDEEGNVRFKNIPYGKYSVAEKIALEGYIPSTEVREVSIIEEGKVVSIDKWENEPIRSSGSTLRPPTDEPKKPEEPVLPPPVITPPTEVEVTPIEEPTPEVKKETPKAVEKIKKSVGKLLPKTGKEKASYTLGGIIFLVSGLVFVMRKGSRKRG